LVIAVSRSADELGEQRVGGKAAGLELLRRVGARVPAFEVLPTECFRAHLRRPEVVGGIGEALLALGEHPAAQTDPTALGEISALFGAAINSVPANADVRGAVQRSLDALGDGPYAVRSSMVGEDSRHHSFAGQLRSELFQRSAEQVLDSVLACWSSAFGVPALMYGARVGLSPGDVHVAVVLQVMLDADVAGVAFSANPLTGAREECLVTAAYGLGEGVVADVAPSDTYRWSASGGELSATVSSKDTRVGARADGAGTELHSVPAPLRDQRALSVAQVAEVGALVSLVAAEVGQAMDVEWCFAERQLFALQARPVTSLAPDPAASAQVRVFDNSNIQESYSGVTTPLTFSFATRQYETIYSAMLRELGASKRTCEQFRPAARTMLALIDGRVYYNLDSWRQLLEAFPRGRQRLQEVETVMLHTSIGSPTQRDRAWSARARRAIEVTGMSWRLAAILLRQDAVIDRYVERFERFYDGIDRERLRERSLDDLHEALTRFEPEIVAPGATAYLNDLRVAITSGRLRKLVSRVYGEGQADTRLADLLSGISGLESVAPIHRLMEIASDVRGDELLAAQLRACAPREVVEVLRRGSPELVERLDGYVRGYGDRMIGELKLETRPLRDDPRVLGEVILNYLAREDLDPERVQQVERERGRAAIGDLAKRLPGWRRRLLGREVALARTAVRCRERLRLRRTWGFALARDLYRAIGTQLHAAGALERPDDVMYLTVEEIDAFIEGHAVSASLVGIVQARRAEFERYRQTPVLHRLRTHGSPYLAVREDLSPGLEPSDAPDSDGVTLRGMGCCAGVVEAPVRVILDPSESLSLNGEILCTMRTDPGWAPLFATVSGLIVERGSTLSHSAVVARELGIPTVVGVAGVTRILTNGERVRLNGSAGLVQRLDTPKVD
jgi:pyruvate,water dikinase